MDPCYPLVLAYIYHDVMSFGLHIVWSVAAVMCKSSTCLKAGRSSMPHFANVCSQWQVKNEKNLLSKCVIHARFPFFHIWYASFLTSRADMEEKLLLYLNHKQTCHHVFWPQAGHQAHIIKNGWHCWHSLYKFMHKAQRIVAVVSQAGHKIFAWTCCRNSVNLCTE